MTQSPQQAAGVLEPPSHAATGSTAANAFRDQISDEEVKAESLSLEKEEIAARVKEMLLGEILGNTTSSSQEPPSDTLDSTSTSGVKRIEIRASSNFVDTLDGLCLATGFSRADVLRRGVVLYARALQEKNMGRVLGIAALEDNQIKIKEIIQV